MYYKEDPRWNLNEPFIRGIESLVHALQVKYRDALLRIDHGGGNTAGAFRDREGTIWTAQHTVASGVGRVIFPNSADRMECGFDWRGDDTAASRQKVNGWENGIPTGYPQAGDVNVALLARTSRSGLQVCSFWGEFVGLVRPLHDTWYGFRRRGGVNPKLGDSGNPILTVGRDGVALPEPFAIGLLHGMEGDICLFS